MVDTPRWPGWSALFCAVICMGLLSIFALFTRRVYSKYPSINETANPSPYPPIEPLPDFDWKTKEPIKPRPFKPKYNLTMSIQDGTVSELIEIDKNYLNRINLRKKIIAEHPDIVLAAADCVKPALDEFYIWLVGTYLPTRYPRMFQLSPATGSGGGSGKKEEKQPAFLDNLVNGERVPVSPGGDKPLDTLRTLGGLIEDDLLFLLPSEDGDSYTLRGLVTCFPNGFNTSQKLNLKLRDIHKPVPEYKEKLEKSMDRYFSRLPVGKFIMRANWTITTTGELFTPSGNHLYEGEEIPQETVNPDIARVRVERQYLHRLPQSQALVFSFKTLQYSLDEIKDEGLGETLAEAIDGLRQGNAPGFHFYKRAAVWGESAKAYLTNHI